MTDYEVLLMLDPELPEERQGEIVARVRERVEADGGAWDAQQPWGRRRLAYEIGHKHDATYHLLTFASEAETLDEVSRVLRITDGVMRHLAVRRVTSGRTPIPPPPPAPAESVSTGEYAGSNTRSSSRTEAPAESEEEE